MQPKGLIHAFHLHMNKDLLLINTAAFLRSVSIGLTGVVVGIYLFRNGFSSLGIGLVIGTGLAGAAFATLVVTLRADHLGRRPTLLFLAFLGSFAGIALAITPPTPLLLLLAFVGMLNGMGTDRSAAFALEQAIIPGLEHELNEYMHNTADFSIKPWPNTPHQCRHCSTSPNHINKAAPLPI